jgi:creatinine amidohydrolase
MRSRQRYLYADLTWLEIKEAIAAQKVVVLPVGTVEQHGPHLPMDTDNLLVQAVCEEAARREPDQVLIMPAVPYGFNWHHIDFPGTIGIDVTNLLNYLLDITKSVAYHGFKKILIVSGHGSNTSLCDLVARKTVLETDAICASLMYGVLGRDVVAEVVKSPVSHACEWETSLYLYVAGERVQMDQAVRDINTIPSKYTYRGILSPSAVSLMEWWSSFSESGTVGDPTLATAEKGEKIFNATVEGMVGLITEFRNRPIRPRRDHHGLNTG